MVDNKQYEKKNKNKNLSPADSESLLRTVCGSEFHTDS